MACRSLQASFEAELTEHEGVQELLHLKVINARECAKSCVLRAASCTYRSGVKIRGFMLARYAASKVSRHGQKPRESEGEGTQTAENESTRLGLNHLPLHE